VADPVGLSFDDGDASCGSIDPGGGDRELGG
jgi:hypothetical protein